MKNKVEYGFAGGFPLVQDTLGFMQQAFSYLEGFSEMICTQQGGRYLIIRGAQNADGQVADGVVIFDGELLPLIGGAAQDFVHVEQTVQTAVFMDGNVQPIYVSRKVVFGEGDGQVEWASFQPVTRKFDPNGSYPTLDAGILGGHPAEDYLLKSVLDASAFEYDYVDVSGWTDPLPDGSNSNPTIVGKDAPLTKEINPNLLYRIDVVERAGDDSGVATGIVTLQEDYWSMVSLPSSASSYYAQVKSAGGSTLRYLTSVYRISKVYECRPKFKLNE